MGTRTLLQLIADTCNELGIDAPSAVIASTDPQIKQLLALAQREGMEYYDAGTRLGGWQELVTEYTFPTVASTASYALPSDFAYFVQRTFWDRTNFWQLMGPLNAQEWQVLKSGIQPTGPRRRFRIKGNLFYIDPTPSDVSTLVYEYYSKNWCQSAAAATQARWAADDDTYRLDDQAFILGLIWRWKHAKGFAYAEDRLIYDNKVDRNNARNGGNRPLPLNASGRGLHLLSDANVPDTGFGT